MEALDRIAIIDQDGQLALLSPGDGAVVRLTHGDEQFQFPAWSPDNQWLALIGGTVQQAGLFLLAADGADSRPLRPLYTTSTQPPIYLAWSPSSALISVLAVHPELRMGLYLLDREQPTSTVLPTAVIGGQPCFWHWHGDSQGLLAHVDLGHRSAHLTHVRWRIPTSPSIQPLDIQPGFFQAPSIAHDGRRIAYAQLSHTGESQLVVASRERKIIIGEHNGVTALNWSPTSEQLAFIHPQTATQYFYGPLHIWQAESEQVVRVSAETVIAFFWSPNGRRIAYFTVEAAPHSEAQPSTTGATNGRVAKTWPFLQAATAPPMPALGLHCVDVASGMDQKIATCTPSRPFLDQYLPFFDQYAKSHPIWSRQSDALVLPISVDGRSTITLVDLRNERLEPLAAGDMATWCW